MRSVKCVCVSEISYFVPILSSHPFFFLTVNFSTQGKLLASPEVIYHWNGT